MYSFIPVCKVLSELEEPTPEKRLKRKFQLSAKLPQLLEQEEHQRENEIGHLHQNVSEG